MERWPYTFRLKLVCKSTNPQQKACNQSRVPYSSVSSLSGVKYLIELFLVLQDNSTEITLTDIQTWATHSPTLSRAMFRRDSQLVRIIAFLGSFHTDLSAIVWRQRCQKIRRIPILNAIRTRRKQKRKISLMCVIYSLIFFTFTWCEQAITDHC